METRAGAEGLCAIHRQADARKRFCSIDARIRCWRAGNMAWAARPCSPPTPKPRWAADWVTWKGYDKFWTNLCRDLLPHAQAGEATVEFDSANGDLVVDYRLGRDVRRARPRSRKFSFSARTDSSEPIAVKKIAAGTFRGRLQIGAREGLFRVRPLDGIARVSRSGIVSAGSRTGRLRVQRGAAQAGRRVHRRPLPARSESGVRCRAPLIASTMQLWPGLLALAIVLNLVELVMRKWKGVLGKA